VKTKQSQTKSGVLTDCRQHDLPYKNKATGGERVNNEVLALFEEGEMSTGPEDVEMR
jgi:hypothetical protein